jgi:hypothetical protein
MAVNQNCIFHGFKSSYKAAEIVLEASIGILPLAESSNAFLPNKFFDYIGASVPIICFKGSDSAYIIEKYNIGWVIPRSADSIHDLFSGADFLPNFLEKKLNIENMRKEFSKEELYKGFVQEINIILKG